MEIRPAPPDPTTSRKRFDWLNALVLTSTPIAAVVLAVWYVRSEGFVWTDLVPFVAMYFLTGLAITAGYHRYYAHRTYACHPIVQALMLLFGAAALQNSALAWVSDHRTHHRHVDQAADPYNIRRGFLWAHIGWIFFQDAPGTPKVANVRDLERSRLVRLQARLYVLLAVGVGLGVPYLIGLAFDRPWGGVLWGGLVRTVLVHHCTFLINSAAHYTGERPYSTEVSARDNRWLALLSYGEGYHNFHHAFPGDYRNGVAWYHFDPTKWTIRSLAAVRLAWGLRRTPVEAIERRRQAARQGTLAA
jgi:stearoyl-CoA desaturase (delta-9 desaturase)